MTGNNQIEFYAKAIKFQEYRRTMDLIEHNRGLKRLRFLPRLEAKRDELLSCYPDFQEHYERLKVEN